MLLNLELDPAIERKINIIFNNTKNKISLKINSEFNIFIQLNN